MFKIVIFLACLVGVLALPTANETRKYPKKYNKEIHGDKKVLIGPSDSSYMNYTTSDQMEAMSPPPMMDYEDATQDLISGDPEYTQDDYGVAVEQPFGDFIPPPVDSYSTFDAEAVFSMLPPEREGPSSDGYLGYSNIYRDFSDYLRAPEKSSYLEVQQQGDSQSNDYSDGLSLPPLQDDSNTAIETSYAEFEQPSSYNNYDKNEATYKIELPPLE